MYKGQAERMMSVGIIYCISLCEYSVCLCFCRAVEVGWLVRSNVISTQVPLNTYSYMVGHTVRLIVNAYLNIEKADTSVWFSNLRSASEKKRSSMILWIPSLDCHQVEAHVSFPDADEVVG